MYKEDPRKPFVQCVQWYQQKHLYCCLHLPHEHRKDRLCSDLHHRRIKYILETVKFEKATKV